MPSHPICYAPSIHLSFYPSIYQSIHPWRWRWLLTNRWMKSSFIPTKLKPMNVIHVTLLSLLITLSWCATSCVILFCRHYWLVCYGVTLPSLLITLSWYTASCSHTPITIIVLTYSCYNHCVNILLEDQHSPAPPLNCYHQVLSCYPIILYILGATSYRF